MQDRRASFRKLLKILARTTIVLILLPVLYLLGAVIGALVPANRGWEEPAQGITIFVQTNGVHTWIVVPKVTAEMDWRPLVPTEHIRDPSLSGSHVAIGYGNREFYLNTPAWEDLTVRRALGAAFGNGPSLVHVYHERQPVPGEDQRPIRITPGQYRRLTAFLVASFDRTAEGHTIPLIGRGYGPSDVFYEARGGYNLYYTCNEWAGDALRTSGISVGIWTPFSQSIMERF